MALWKWRPLFLTSAILIGFLSLAAIGLSRESYWADEVFTLRTARSPWPTLWSLLRADSVHPPLHYIAAKLTLLSGADSLESLRWLSIAAGSVALLFLCQGRHFLAALLISTNAWFVHYSQEVRGYAFLFLGLAMLLWALERAKPGWLVFAAVAWMSWSHYYGILYALAACLVYRERFRPIFLGIASLLPWAVYVAPRFIDGQVTRQLSWIQRSTLGGLLRYFSKIGFGWSESLAGLLLLSGLLFLSWRA